MNKKKHVVAMLKNLAGVGKVLIIMYYLIPESHVVSLEGNTENEVNE